MPFKPGETGNPKGSQKAKPFLDALNRAIVQDDGKRLRAAAERLLTEAENGEPWAIQMLADRCDGKPGQQDRQHQPDQNVEYENGVGRFLNILRLGLYQILFMDRVPVSAAVNESVVSSPTAAPVPLPA